MQKRARWPRVLIGLLLGYLFLPVFVIGFYSVAETWAGTLLPTHFTLSAYQTLFADAAFQDALGRTTVLCLGSVLLTLLVMTPVCFAVMRYAPRLERFFRALMLVPYALPGVVTASALLRTYAGPHGMAVPWILGGAYFILVMPVVYQGVCNSLRAMDVQPLSEAAQTLGASPFQIFMRIVLPGVMPGVLVSALLSLATLFSEFVLASMLTRGAYDTVQLYLQQAMRDSTQLASAVVMVYLAVMTLLCVVFILLAPYTQWEKAQAPEGKE